MAERTVAEDSWPISGASAACVEESAPATPAGERENPQSAFSDTPGPSTQRDSADDSSRRHGLTQRSFLAGRTPEARARAAQEQLTAMRLGSEETAPSPDDVPDDSSDASSVFKVEHHMAAEASPADLRRREQAATTTHPFPPTSALRNTTCACAGATEKGGDRCRERGGAATTRGCQRQRRQPTSRIVARRNRAGPRVR